MHAKNVSYVEVSFGGTNNRTVIREADIKLPANPVDCFKSLAVFPEEFNEYVMRTGSSNGYEGYCNYDFVTIYFDGKDDLKKAQKELRKMVYTLRAGFEIQYDEFLYYFSGDSGFEVKIPAILFANFVSAKSLHSTISRIVDDLRYLATDSPAYDYSRMSRIENTLCSKTGLYKVQLSSHEVLDYQLDRILELAIAPRILNLPLEELFPNYKLIEMKQRYEIPALSKEGVKLPYNPQEQIHSNVPDFRMHYYGTKESKKDNIANKEKKAVIYLRKSKVQNLSLEFQLKHCKKVAESLGLQVVKVYQDDATLGKSLEGKDFNKMYDSVRGYNVTSPCPFSRIIVYSNSSFSMMSPMCYRDVLGLMKLCGVELITAANVFLSDDPRNNDEGRIIKNLLARTRYASALHDMRTEEMINQASTSNVEH